MPELKTAHGALERLSVAAAALKRQRESATPAGRLEPGDLRPLVQAARESNVPLEVWGEVQCSETLELAEAMALQRLIHPQKS